MECPSFSAVTAAMMRAAHLVMDGHPKLVCDYPAIGLSGLDETGLRDALDGFLADTARMLGAERAALAFTAMRGFTAMRARHVEDRLAIAMARGIAQYVILGAGLDSFAYRRRDLAALRVFEVDRQAMLSWKWKRLEQLRVALPDNVAFVPLELGRQGLAEALAKAGFRSDAPAFVSWLGVTQYLNEAAVYATLREVAAMAGGSEIVLEYSVPERQLADSERWMLGFAKASGTARGEQWLSLFEPARLKAKMRDMGFVALSDLGPRQAIITYFARRSDGLTTVPTAHLMAARVMSSSR